MIFGSVCSGIEAASAAWHPLGWKAAWLAEIEPSPSLVLAHHYPNVPNLGDMTKLADMVRRKKIAPPDVLVGGTPCQAFSVAGLRGGLSDGRGFLTIKFVELADAIDEQRPDDKCVIVWENVPGVLSSRDNAFGCFLAGLAGESEPLEPAGGKWPNAGYVSGPSRTIAWRILDAQYFGVAQRRRRVFVVASARDGFDPAAVLFESEGVRRDIAPSREAGKAVAALTANGVGTCGADDNQGQAGHLVPHVVGALTAKGPATMGSPEVDEGHIIEENPTVGALDTECGFQKSTHQSINAGHIFPVGFRMVAFGEYSGDGTASTMKARDYKDATDLAVHCAAYGMQDPIVANDMAHCLGRNSGQENAVCVTGDITHTLKAEGFDGSEDGTGRGQPIVAIHENTRGELRESEISPTLSAGGGKPGQGYSAVRYGMQVRRLTPTECERLQGFPDGYTLVPVGKKQSADGPRYKALGNSMAVPVMRWIGKRVADEIARGILKGMGL